MADAGYRGSAQELCRRSGTLLVLDEVQTGLYRTGRFLAAQHWGIEPDMVVLAKALSGGLVPSAVLLMSDAVYERVYGSLGRSIVHTSTFSENSLAMRAGLATIEVLEREGLAARARRRWPVPAEAIAARAGKLRNGQRDSRSGPDELWSLRMSIWMSLCGRSRRWWK